MGNQKKRELYLGRPRRRTVQLWARRDRADPAASSGRSRAGPVWVELSGQPRVRRVRSGRRPRVVGRAPGRAGSAAMDGRWRAGPVGLGQPDRARSVSVIFITKIRHPIYTILPRIRECPESRSCRRRLSNPENRVRGWRGSGVRGLGWEV